jgi:hypothetical protein
LHAGWMLGEIYPAYRSGDDRYSADEFAHGP